jgi:cyanocobalamin reductase (cyanide-eliminating) / alkylcobalamin dealkylase
VTAAAWQQLVTRVEAGCSAVGLDLVHPFGVGRYNAVAAADQRLEDFGRPDALGILIGNTRELWPAFTRAVRDDAALASSPHPLDTYVTTRVKTLVAEATRQDARFVFAHVTTPRAFPIQRLAESVGLAAVAPCHLAIHPLHGPWFALRAVVVVDASGPSSATCRLERPCDGCSAPCLPALQRALEASGTPLTSAAVAEHASEWIAMRDACPVGRSSRYGAEQLRYHYGPASARSVT